MNLCHIPLTKFHRVAERMSALGGICDILRNQVSKEDLEDSDQTALVDGLMGCIRKGGSSEACLAATALCLVFVTVRFPTCLPALVEARLVWIFLCPFCRFALILMPFSFIAAGRGQQRGPGNGAAGPRTDPQDRQIPSSTRQVRPEPLFVTPIYIRNLK